MGFIIACVGSAVGLGNIWMFPYRLGQYGGAAFLIPYLLFVFLFGWVGLSAEFGVGRLAGTGTIGAYEYCFAARGKKRAGGALGWLPLLGSLGIAIGYAVIMGWVLHSLAGAVTGELMTADPGAFFQQAAVEFGNPGWHLVVAAAAGLVLMLGVTGGIEKVSRVLMPLFFLLFLVLAVWVATLPGAMEGYRFLFVPDWSALLRADTWVMAMGQAFFSLSLAGSGTVVYGSYLKSDVDVVSSAKYVAFFDTAAALLAGLVIIPAVFSAADVRFQAFNPFRDSFGNCFRPLGIYKIRSGKYFPHNVIQPSQRGYIQPLEIPHQLQLFLVRALEWFTGHFRSCPDLRRRGFKP